MLNMLTNLHLILSGKTYKNFRTHELLSTPSQLTFYFCPIVQFVFFFFFLRHFNIIVLFYLCNFGLVLTACSHYFSEKAMAPHSSTLAWKIPWTEEPGRLQSMGSRRVRHLLSDFTFTFHFHALEKEMATHSSVLA